MLLRTWVLVGYGVAVVAAIVFQVLIPALAPYFFFGFLTFLVLSFFLFRLPSMGRPVGASAGGGSSVPVGMNPPAVVTGLGFCMHCGAYLSPGVPACPECGRRVAG